MGSTPRSASVTNSQSPRSQETQLSHRNPEIFRTRPRGATLETQATTHESHSSSRTTHRSRSRSPPSQSPDMQSASALSLADLGTVAADFKNTLSVAISELGSDIQTIALRVEEVEETEACHDPSLCQVQQITESHAVHLREINRHMEDLDNCGRRRKLRVRSLPEAIDHSQLTRSVIALFNDLLERPPDTNIALECIHRVLHPRGRDTDPLREM